MEIKELEQILSQHFEVPADEIKVANKSAMIGSKKYIIFDENEIIEILKNKLDYSYADIDPHYLSKVTSLPEEIFQLLNEKGYNSTVEELLIKFYPGGLDSFIKDTLNNRGYFDNYYQKEFYKKIESKLGLIYLYRDL